MTSAECVCDLDFDGTKIPNPLCPACGDARDTSIAPARPFGLDIHEHLLNAAGLLDAIEDVEPRGDRLRAMPLDKLWDLHEDYAAEIKEAYDQKGRIEQELERRALAARPDFSPQASGTVQMAEGELLLVVSYDREYEYDDSVLYTIQEEKLLTEIELGKLAETVWKWHYRGGYADLMKRGGRLAEVLGPARTLKSAKAKFEPKVRET